MKRTLLLVFGIVIGIVLTVLFQYGLQKYRFYQSRIDSQIIEWAYKDFPRILYPPTIEPEGEFSEAARTLDATWTGGAEGSDHELTITYEVPEGIKRVNITYAVRDDRAQFPSQDEVRRIDSSTPALQPTTPPN